MSTLNTLTKIDVKQKLNLDEKMKVMESREPNFILLNDYDTSTAHE